jgi:hypothetical protein
MKTFFVIAFFAAVLLEAKSTDLFASSESCTAKTCSNTVNNKKLKVEVAAPETDPFTILIPGNHF